MSKLTGSLTFTILLSAAAVAGAQEQQQQTPPPASPPAAQQPVEPAIGFTSDAGMMFNLVKAESVADFEMVLGRLKEALQKSENPQRRQQAASWKVYKSAEPPQVMPCPAPPSAAGEPAAPAAQCQAVMYIFVFDKTVKAVDYDPVKILSEAFPTEVNALYEKLKNAYLSLNKSAMSALIDMSTPGGM